ncbi:Ig-like domain repeat protein [Paenibacillus oleatilyticus]|uniref:Ig-like domain repeat protein n=1 Tax=Paenibacillus oleatilyticus TaxID=2594886 RepID=A0ABV4UUZ7_9BACL
MPYIESIAYKDGYVDFYGGPLKGTTPDLYVGEKGTNNYIALIAFNFLSIPQWSSIQKVEIFLVGADYVDGKTSGTLKLGVTEQKWNENDSSFSVGGVYAPVDVNWSSQITPGVTYSFDVTELAKTKLSAFFDGGILIMGNIFGGNSPGLLKFRSRESGSPPILRITYESDTTPPTVGSLTGTQYLNIQPNNTFRLWAYNVTDNWSGVSIVRFPTAGPGSDFQWRDGVRDGGSNNWYCDIPISAYGNNEGLYTTHVYTYDNAGNNGFVGAISTYVDRTPPTVASVQGYSYSNQTSGTRRVWIYGAADTVSGIASVEVIYYAAGTTFRGPFPAGQSGNDYYFDVPIYAGDGQYKTEFTLRDRAGNSSSYQVYFLVDSQRPNDPNVSVTYGETAATFTWLRFSDPAPTSDYAKTLFYLGEWTGTEWVGGAPNLFNGTEITRDYNVLEKQVFGLKPGARYRYTLTHYDKAGNESAYTWREYITKKKIGEIELEDANRKLTFPIYDPESGVLGSKALRIAIAAGIGCFELSSAGVSLNPFMVQTAKGIMTIQ